MAIRMQTSFGAITLPAARSLKTDLLLSLNYSSWVLACERLLRNVDLNPLLTESRGRKTQKRILKNLLLFSRKYIPNIICANYWSKLLCVNTSDRKKNFFEPRLQLC